MAPSTNITPLKVGDIEYLVSSTIERCPHTMMPRELLMNAIEAAQRDSSGNGLVVVRAKKLEQFPNTQKLGIWNNGPGMSDIELSSICNLAASSKTMSLEANFGMGAKVSALGVNHLGMRYRSCKSGVVSQVVIGFEDGMYGKLRQPVRDKKGVITFEDVTNVTEIVRREEEYRLDHDWTEVVLLGNAPNQNTVFDPYGDGKTVKQWLHDALYHRFYRIPDNVTIKFEEDAHTGDSDRKFRTIPQRLHLYGRHETVLTLEGIKLSYIHDPARPDGSHNISRNGAMSSTPSHASIVFRGEMYDVRRSNSWSAISPEFGIPFGSRHILVHIELPDDYNVVPEAYRRFIQMADGNKSQVFVTEFASLVREHRPEWLVEIIKSFGPKPSVDANQIEKELQELLNSLSVRATGPRIDPEGEKKVNEGAGRGEGPKPNNTHNLSPNPGPGSKPTRYLEAIDGARRATSAAMRETAPKITYLDEDENIEERDVVDRAARFVQETNDLYINTKYRAIDEFAAYLEKVFASAVAEHGEAVKITAKKIAVNTATVRAGRAVVHAKAKGILNSWDDEAIQRACMPECLSVVVDDWAEVAEHAYKQMRKNLGLSARQAREQKVAA